MTSYLPGRRLVRDVPGRDSRKLRRRLHWPARYPGDIHTLDAARQLRHRRLGVHAGAPRTARPTISERRMGRRTWSAVWVSGASRLTERGGAGLHHRAEVHGAVLCGE